MSFTRATNTNIKILENQNTIICQEIVHLKTQIGRDPIIAQEIVCLETQFRQNYLEINRLEFHRHTTQKLLAYDSGLFTFNGILLNSNQLAGLVQRIKICGWDIRDPKSCRYNNYELYNQSGCIMSINRSYEGGMINIEIEGDLVGAYWYCEGKEKCFWDS